LRLREDGRYRPLPIVEDRNVLGIVSRFDFSGLELDRLDEKTGLATDLSSMINRYSNAACSGG
jgi:hypothetical protein